MSQNIERVQEAMAALEAATAAALESVHVYVNAAVAATAELSERNAQRTAALAELDAAVEQRRLDLQALESRAAAFQARRAEVVATLAEAEAQAARAQAAR
jgi:hypothetical protein